MRIDDAELKDIQEEFNNALDQLFYLMEKKKTDQGDISLKISVNLTAQKEEFIDEDGTIHEEIIKVPTFDYNITQTLKLTNKIKGTAEPFMKLAFDNATGRYHLVEIQDGQTKMEI
jgi:hypothetical protein